MSLGIGDTLRDARRRIGCTLADAAADTRVRESYLAAIEQEDFAGLGGDVYVKGFIASYARYLRLDPAPLLDAYRTHAETPVEGRGNARPGVGAIPGGGFSRERPAGAAVLLVLLLVVMLALIAFSLRGDGEGEGGAAGGAAVATGAVAVVEPVHAG